MNINQLVKEAHGLAKEKGWHDTERSFGELIALCHSELSEALEEYRDGMGVTTIYDEIDNNEKPCGIPIELADVVIRIADMCGLYGIDLEGAIKQKLEYNRGRAYRHGNKKC